MQADVHQNITLVKIYFVFRTLLASVLAGMFLSGIGNDILGESDPVLFLWASVTYASVCVGTTATIFIANLSHSFNRVTGSLVIDVVAVIVLLHASGGVSSGLGYLLIVFVAISSIFIRGQLGVAFAAMVSILLMAETILLTQDKNDASRLIFSAGILGILLFCTAFVFQVLTDKIKTTSLEAAAQAEFAEQLQKLAEAIVARMRTGIIVVDELKKIELINDSAIKMLGLDKNKDYSSLRLFDLPALHPLTSQSTDDEAAAPSQLIDLEDGNSLRVSVSLLELGPHSRKVFYLEDHRAMTQQAQQLKLASLGRLTASIAHEIRNPLGALSHAAQLLAESDNIAQSDLRLTEIIHQHSNRVNQIVESTLALSRRKEPQPQTMDLEQWLPNFLSQYKLAHQPEIQLEFLNDIPLARIDPTHFSQVLTNLLDNGLRYGHKRTGEFKIRLEVNRHPNDETAYLDVIDFGEGINKEQESQIFDPFYTTDEKGSGLGLYISKELCEINQATLVYRRTDSGESCFRISFSHHQRMF